MAPLQYPESYIAQRVAAVLGIGTGLVWLIGRGLRNILAGPSIASFSQPGQTAKPVQSEALILPTFIDNRNEPERSRRGTKIGFSATLSNNWFFRLDF